MRQRAVTFFLREAVWIPKMYNSVMTGVLFFLHSPEESDSCIFSLDVHCLSASSDGWMDGWGPFAPRFDYFVATEIPLLENENTLSLLDESVFFFELCCML